MFSLFDPFVKLFDPFVKQLMQACIIHLRLPPFFIKILYVMRNEFLIISDNRVIHKVPVAEIVHVESKGMYSEIHTASGTKHCCCKNMGAIFKLLEKASNFFRVHTSHAVNLDHVAKVKRIKQGYIIMSNGSVIPISKRRKTDFFKNYFPDSRI